ncbi:hypothetical protein [Amycolatopsis sp. GM8]|uniref:hypothetical protein n=1 Tax=Amycolatopsis sp. GM8 TaxID=2896530 RepID=UPI001F44F3D0|nr:hypothetical protein [Amycolatopsis sp. GM8]
MIVRRAPVAGLLIACCVTLAACSGGGITVDAARKAATAAGPTPTGCPVPYDVSAALSGRPVQPGEVQVQVSKTTTPAPDPLVAQRDQGMSALDAAAGVAIDCEYQVAGHTLDTWLVVTPAHAAVAIMAPRITQAAHLDIVQIQDFLNHQPAAGEVKLTTGGDVAVARVPVDGDGDASLLVDPDGVVSGDDLSKAAQTLLGQIHF